MKPCGDLAPALPCSLFSSVQITWNFVSLGGSDDGKYTLAYVLDHSVDFLPISGRSLFYRSISKCDPKLLNELFVADTRFGSEKFMGLMVLAQRMQMWLGEKLIKCSADIAPTPAETFLGFLLLKELTDF